MINVTKSAIDKTSLNLISIVLGGTGLFVVLTKFSVPELNASFFEMNPFAIKRDVIESVMTRIFTLLTTFGLLVQVVVAIVDGRLKERVHGTRFYTLLFVVVLAMAAALVPLLTAIGRRVARGSWLPQIVENQKELYAAARFVIEHDGDQLPIRAPPVDPADHRAANLKNAALQVEQIEKLFDITNDPRDLKARLDRIRPYFERK